MKLLLDECVDWRLARDIVGHDVKTARQMGWTTVENGALLTLASFGGAAAWSTLADLESAVIAPWE